MAWRPENSTTVAGSTSNGVDDVMHAIFATEMCRIAAMQASALQYLWIQREVKQQPHSVDHTNTGQRRGVR